MVLRKRKDTGILKDKALDRYHWRTRFEKGYGNPAGQTSSTYP
jgi:hypothetical protein